MDIHSPPPFYFPTNPVSWSGMWGPLSEIRKLKIQTGKIQTFLRICGAPPKLGPSAM